MSPATEPPRCPICEKPQHPKFRPFCSGRCANIDLGRWLGGRYAIPGADEDKGSSGVEDGEGGQA